MNSTTANVFITTSKDVIQEFLNISKVTTKSYFSKLSDAQKRASIIAGPEFNSNLIELDHTFNFGGDGSYLKLRMVENGQSFEQQFISTDVYPEIVGNLLKEKKQLGGAFVDLDRGLEKEILSPTREIYFSYGIGDSAENWAGPFVMSFMKGDISINENGIKEIVLEFRGEVGKILRNEIEGISSDIIYQTLNKYDHIYSNKTVRYRKSAEIKIDSNLDRFLFLFKGNDFDLEKSIHNKIKEIIKNYIIGLINDYSSSTNSLNENVIVLLPNVLNLTDILTTKYFEKATTIEGSELEDANILHHGVMSDMIVVRIEGTIKGTDKVVTLTKSNLVRRDEIFANSLFRRPDAEEILDSLMPDAIVKQLGLECEIVHDKVSAQANSLNNSSPRNVDVANDSISEAKSKSLIIKISINLDNNNKESSSEITPDFYFPLQEFNNKFKELINSELKIRYNQTLLLENNLNILKIWKKYGFIKDENKPAFIFGDQNLIEDLLYLANAYSIVDAGTINYNKDNIFDLDYKLYSNPTYRLDYYTKMKLRKRSSSFGENVLLNDELALSERELTVLKILDIPIFRFNIANPNVLSVSLQNNLIYKTVLDVGYENKLMSTILDTGTVDVGNIDESTKVFEKAETKDARATTVTVGDLTNLFSKLYKNTDFTGKTSSEKLKEINSFIENYAKMNNQDSALELNKNLKLEQLSFILLRKLTGGSDMLPVIQTANSNQKVLFEKELYDELTKMVLQVNVKTLPFFSITGYTKDTSCFFVGLQNIIGDGTGKKVSSIYNGRYYVLGYRHFISSRDAYSEFQLSKDANYNNK